MKAMQRKMNNKVNLHASIKEKLAQAEKPLILSHVRPDGDAIGSVVGLSLALKQAGKSPQGVLVDGVPRKFKIIAGTEDVRTGISGEYDAVIAVDCADMKRVGFPNGNPDVDINIDHHVTNELYGALNLVEPDQPATTSILAKYLPEWGFPITREVADALMMGMVTDTIGFSTSNVNPEFLRISADLLDKGADLTGIYHKTITEKSLAASLLWGNALARLKWEGQLAWTVITLEDRANADYEARDDADLTNHLSALENIDISVLFNEQKDEKVKISWRSPKKFDVSKIAVKFNGGGHPPAAGADVDGKLEDVIEAVLGETKKFIQGKN